MKPKVVVNGIGAIGKRVAHAVRLQKDMELVGISDVSPTSTLKTNLEPEGPLHGTDLYCSVPDMIEKLRKDMYVKGTLPDLLKSGTVDLVIDCTPEGIGAKNKETYERFGVKSIFQGGEKAGIAEMTFNTFVNYEQAFGKSCVRVPSCNTTSLARTMWAIDNRIGIESVFVSLVRRAVDPWNPSKGPINSIVPDDVPSHHGPDLKTIMPNLNIMTMAVKVPTTLTHVHVVSATLKRDSTTEEVKKVFSETPRITLLKKKDGYTSTSEIIERYRDLGRPRYDMPEVAIWDELVSVIGNKLFWNHAVHSESIVIPENIDCIRAMFGLEKDKWECVKRTNESLGIK
ncbi:glyceraldehyde-3-phosphate dehydrogenase [Candidatus Micrarchaeota archaeon RBG_16_49_10]|nr:MAG: glyceraldehyde-3-phosphate dehydrogenase [Candidatus Micrarchaeota archaeon RBG_16_49_10]